MLNYQIQFRPVDIGLNADTRMLGLGVLGMTLIP